MGTDRVIEGREGARTTITFFHQRAFSSQIDATTILCGEANATLEARFKGVHVGEFEGVPASHRHVDVPYAVAYDLRGDRISALRLYFPLELLIRQITGVAQSELHAVQPPGTMVLSRATGGPMRATVLALIAAAALSPPTPRSPVRVTKALVGGLLIDGYAGPPIQNSVILIEGDKISAVGQLGKLAIPAGADVISTEGMTVLPGLWDMHVHTMIVGHADYEHWDKAYMPQFESVIMPAAAKQLLMAGVTSARDLGGPLEASIHVRDNINAGRIPGATLYVAGPFIQHEPYPNTEAYRWGVKGPDDGRAKVRKIADAGVDVVKLIDQDQMTLEEVKAIVDEAHAHGKPVVAHAHRPEEIRRGLAAGVDCFEHTGLAAAPAYPDDIISAIRERTAKMSLGPLYWTPTIEGLLNYEYLRDNPEALDDPAWHEGLPDNIVADIRASLEHPDRLPYFQLTAARRPTLARKFQQLREAGVVQLIGTDSGIPMNFHSHSTWRELDAWVATLGVDPMTAIRAATYWPSVAMKVDTKVGTVSPGKYADIIAVRGDVLRYISLLQRVDVVIKHGVRYK